MKQEQKTEQAADAAEPLLLAADEAMRAEIVSVYGHHIWPSVDKMYFGRADVEQARKLLCGTQAEGEVDLAYLVPPLGTRPAPPGPVPPSAVARCTFSCTIDNLSENTIYHRALPPRRATLIGAAASQALDPNVEQLRNNRGGASHVPLTLRLHADSGAITGTTNAALPPGAAACTQLLKWWIDAAPPPSAAAAPKRKRGRPPSSILDAAAQAAAAAAADASEGSLLHELRSVQRELQQLEASNAHMARGLLACVEREAAAEADVAARTADQRRAQAAAMAIWSVRMESLRRERELQAAQVEEDADAVCCVCDAGDTARRDTIVFCDRCDLAVHVSCYRIAGALPEGAWYCRPCDAHIAAGGAASRCPQPNRGPHDIACALCPARGGAFAPADTPADAAAASSVNGGDGSCGGENSMDVAESQGGDGSMYDGGGGAGGGSRDAPRYGTDHGWVHVACARWLASQNPEVTETPSGEVSCAAFVAGLRLARAAGGGGGERCGFCEARDGALLHCVEPGCESRFHVPCARAHAETYMESARSCEETGQWRVYCPRHSAAHLEAARAEAEQAEAARSESLAVASGGAAAAAAAAEGGAGGTGGKLPNRTALKKNTISKKIPSGGRGGGAGGNGGGGRGSRAPPPPPPQPLAIANGGHAASLRCSACDAAGGPGVPLVPCSASTRGRPYGAAASERVARAFDLTRLEPRSRSRDDTRPVRSKVRPGGVAGLSCGCVFCDACTLAHGKKASRFWVVPRDAATARSANGPTGYWSCFACQRCACATCQQLPLTTAVGSKRAGGGDRDGGDGSGGEARGPKRQRGGRPSGAGGRGRGRGGAARGGNGTPMNGGGGGRGGAARSAHAVEASAGGLQETAGAGGAEGASRKRPASAAQAESQAPSKRGGGGGGGSGSGGSGGGGGGGGGGGESGSQRPKGGELPSAAERGGAQAPTPSASGSNHPMVLANNTYLNGLLCQVCGGPSTLGLWACGALSRADLGSGAPLEPPCPWRCVAHWKCYNNARAPPPPPAAGRRLEFKCDACLAARPPAALAPCAICPCPGGALKAAFGNQGLGGGDAWVHAACAKWTPELAYRDRRCAQGVDLATLTEERRALRCCLCNGHCAIPCSHTRGARQCGVFAHATCARQAGLHMAAVRRAGGGGVAQYQRVLLCPEHRPAMSRLAARLRALCAPCAQHGAAAAVAAAVAAMRSGGDADAGKWSAALLQLMWCWRTAEYEVVSSAHHGSSGSGGGGGGGGGAGQQELQDALRALAQRLHEVDSGGGDGGVPLDKALGELLRAQAFGPFSAEEIEYTTLRLLFAHRQLSCVLRPPHPRLLLPPSPPPLLPPSLSQRPAAAAAAAAAAQGPAESKSRGAAAASLKGVNAAVATAAVAAHLVAHAKLSAAGYGSSGGDGFSGGSGSKDGSAWPACSADKCEHADERACAAAAAAVRFMLQCSRCDRWYHPWCLGYTRSAARNAWAPATPRSGAVGGASPELALDARGLPLGAVQWFCTRCYRAAGDMVVAFAHADALAAAAAFEGDA